MRLHASHARASFALVTAVFVLILSACSSGSSSTSTTSTSTPTTSDPLLGKIGALPGYTVGLFAKGTTDYSAPDSIDNQGNLVLIDQGGNEIITISNPGTPQQQVSRIPAGDQLDDTVWATTGQGELLVADGVLNAIFTVRTNFVVGSPNKWIYTEAPNDSGTVSFVGTVDPTTGFITPVVIGLGKPTGLYFLPDHS
jgi:hypothetical protein